MLDGVQVLDSIDAHVQQCEFVIVLYYLLDCYYNLVLPTFQVMSTAWQFFTVLRSAF